MRVNEASNDIRELLEYNFYSAFFRLFFTASLTFALTDADFSRRRRAQGAEVKRNYFRALRASATVFPFCCFTEKSPRPWSRSTGFFPRPIPLRSLPSLVSLAGEAFYEGIRARRAHFRTACSPTSRSRLCGCSSRYKRRNEKERKRHPPFVLRSTSRRGR